MNELAIATDLADANEFFQPVETNSLEILFIQYNGELQKIHEIDEVINGEGYLDSLNYYIKTIDTNRYTMPPVKDIFQKDKAISALDAEYWEKALNLTDIYEYMPQSRRSEWTEQIRERKTPPFIEKDVVATLQTLLSERPKFFAERVDGFFKGLSKEHVTNRPEGFSKRMIMNNAFQYGDTPNHEIYGHLSDLRRVIAKFTHRDDEVEEFNNSRELMKACRRRTGIWHDADGGTIRIKTFKKGTMHVEVHPDIALKLNEVLAFIYPSAIPAKFKTRAAASKSSKAFKKFDLDDNLISPNIINKLEYRARENGHVIQLNNRYDFNKATEQKIDSIFAAIGGIKTKEEYNLDRWGHDKATRTVYKFDYDARDVLDDIKITARYPDFKSHQYYPTNETLADKAVMMAGVLDGHKCLEPSAGQGGIAKFLPVDSTTCIEVSRVHCDILEAKGFNVECADFLEYAMKTNERFDRIVMNPPFSEGRAKLHLEAAYGLLKSGGRLVAILPSSFEGKQLVDGGSMVFSQIYANEFEGTSVNVVIVTIEKD